MNSVIKKIVYGFCALNIVFLTACGSGESNTDTNTTLYMANESGLVIDNDGIISGAGPLGSLDGSAVNALGYSSTILWNIGSNAMVFAATANGNVWGNNSSGWTQLAGPGTDGSLDDSAVNTLTTSISGIYVGTESGNVWAYGGLGWVMLNGLESNGTLDSSPVTAINTVYDETTGVDVGNVYTGTQLGGFWIWSSTEDEWTQIIGVGTNGSLDDSSLNAIGIGSSAIYAGTALGNVWIYNYTDVIQIPGGGVDGSIDGSAINALLANGNTIYVGTESGNVWTYAGNTWSQLTSSNIDGDLDGSPVLSLALDGNILYAGTSSGNLWYLDVSVSDSVWTRNESYSQYGTAINSLVFN